MGERAPPPAVDLVVVVGGSGERASAAHDLLPDESSAAGIPIRDSVGRPWLRFASAVAFVRPLCSPPEIGVALCGSFVSSTAVESLVRVWTWGIGLEGGYKG